MHMLPISRSSGRASFKLLSWTAFASVLTLSTCIKAEIACPCATPDLCKPIRTQHEKEVFGFSFIGENATWRGWDWTRLTTVAWNARPDIVCHAHAHGARVVLNADVSHETIANATARKLWVAEHLKKAKELFADGTNFDMEDPVPYNDTFAKQYTALIQETADAFHAAIPGSQISVDIPWSPYGIDGRWYDWLGMAKAADLLFFMAYDMQAQIWGRCVASANSPVELTERGLRQFLDLGVPPSKLVLGVPWYGYRYECLPSEGETHVPEDVDVCLLASIPFRNASCSDAAGREYNYYELLHWQRGSSQPRRWDPLQKAPFFNFKDNGTVYQVWYDDPESLAAKYRLAQQLGLRGVGMWHLDTLDYASNDPQVQNETAAMWEAIDAFLEAPAKVVAAPPPVQPTHQ